MPSARRCTPRFAVHTVHIVGRRRWNRRCVVVTDRYQRLCHHDSTIGLLEFAAGAGLTGAVDNVPCGAPGADRCRGNARYSARKGLALPTTFFVRGYGVDRPVRADAEVLTPAWPLGIAMHA